MGWGGGGGEERGRGRQTMHRYHIFNVQNYTCYQAMRKLSTVGKNAPFRIEDCE